MRPKGMHHQPFSVELWNSWLRRFNRGPNLRLKEGIQEFRSLLAEHEHCYRRLRRLTP